MQKENANNRIGVRITDSLKERLEKRAMEEGRSVSNLIVHILTDYLNKIDDAKKLLKS